MQWRGYIDANGFGGLTNDQWPMMITDWFSSRKMSACKNKGTVRQYWRTGSCLVSIVCTTMQRCPKIGIRATRSPWILNQLSFWNSHFLLVGAEMSVVAWAIYEGATFNITNMSELFYISILRGGADFGRIRSMVFSKQTKINFGSKRNKPKQDLFRVCFGEPKTKYFGLFRCFEPISKQPNQTEQFRSKPKQT